jgi:thiamine kinase-like enzyme
MLEELHGVLRSYPGEVPLVCATDIPRALRLLDQAGDVASGAEVEVLRASAEELAPFLAEADSRWQPVHGDAHPGNMIATRDGLVWIDFEDVCRAPVEWDRAWLMEDGVAPRRYRLDPEVLARCDQLRSLQVALALVTFYDDFGDQKGWDTGLRYFLGTLAGAGREVGS